MSTLVQLYVYDLSRGLAAQLSMSLIGQHVRGIWHTSVVVFGKEIFYGQGIFAVRPGSTQYGTPIRVVEMGTTEVDQETFDQYLEDINPRFTAENYHLMEFNCNTFSDECMQFLTGNPIPEYIRSLPSDFLSTPLGRSLQPTIEAMFRRGAASSSSLEAAPAVSSASSGVAAPSRSTATLTSSSGSISRSLNNSTSATSTAPIRNDIAPVTICSDPITFQSILARNRAVVAFFTSPNCGPCQMVEPSFEDLANSKKGVAFVKVDMHRDVGITSQFEVRVVPTFMFFLDARKKHEIRGANVSELRAQVDLLIHEVFPPHPHSSLSLPAVDSMPLRPTLFDHIPDLDKLLIKLNGFVDSTPSWTSAVSQAQVKQVMSKKVIPFLKASHGSPPSSQLPSTSFDFWPTLTETLVSNLGVDQLFPIVDIWRIAFLIPNFAEWSVTKKVPHKLTALLLCKPTIELKVSRSYILTLLKMFSNTFSDTKLASETVVLLVKLKPLLASTLQHEDQTVRQAAASLVYNIAVCLQNQRRKPSNGDASPEVDEEDEVEMICAILEAIKQENKSEEIVYRLIASLALLLRFSPFMEQMVSLVTVLDARKVLREKLKDKVLITRAEVRKLATEVAEHLCH